MMSHMKVSAETGAAVQELGHRPGLDGLRGVAVLAVVAFHAFPHVIRGGGVGVDVFFVLSGFLITTLLLEEWERWGSVKLGRFYLRRALRLFPALAAFVAFLAVWYSLTDAWMLDVHLAWVPLVYLTNMMMAFDLGTVSHGHVWSLAMEEQFYFVWPLLLLVLLRHGRMVVVVTTGGLALASTVTAFALWAQGADWDRINYGPDARATPILIGCLLAQLRVWRLLPPMRLGRWPLVALAVFVLTPLAYQFGGGYTLVALAAAGTVLVAVNDPPAWMAHRSLVRVGALSYAMYLWHPFLLDLAGERPAPRLLAAVAAYPVAAVSMAFVERPFLALKDQAPTRSIDRNVATSPSSTLSAPPESW